MTKFPKLGAALAVPALSAIAVAQAPTASVLPMASAPPGFAAVAAPATAPIPAAPSPLGIAPYPPPPGGPTVWNWLGVSDAQREYRQRQLARTPLGKVREKIQTPLSIVTGGIIPAFPPKTPSLAELMDPGAVGAAAKVKLDRAAAKDRIDAVRYLGTVDCHYWPEAEDALVGALRADRNEWVRLAAAETLAKGCCCTKKTILALSIAAACSDADGNPIEKSPRVVAAAQIALAKCVTQACDGPIGEPVNENPVKTKEEESGEGAPAKPKPGPTGVEKGAGGLSPDKISQPTGSDFYNRVTQLAWGEVIAIARESLAKSPPVSPEVMNSVVIDNQVKNSSQMDGGDHSVAESERPTNLYDYLRGTNKPAVQIVSQLPSQNPVPIVPMAPRVAPQRSVQQVAKPVPSAKPAHVSAPMTTTYHSIGFGDPVRIAQPVKVKPQAPVTQAMPMPATTAVTTVPAPQPLPSPIVRVDRVQTVKDHLANTQDAKLIEAAIQTLTGEDLRDNAAMVSTLLRTAEDHADVSVRTASVRALARCKAASPAVLAGLERLINDRNVDVRVESAVALVELRTAK